MLYRQQTKDWTMNFSIELKSPKGQATGFHWGQYEALAKKSPRDPSIDGIELLDAPNKIEFERFSDVEYLVHRSKKIRNQTLKYCQISESSTQFLL